MSTPLRIALLTSDNRECFRDYANPLPHFGAAPEALMQGFAQLPEVEVDVVCCVRKPVPPHDHLAPNIRYHALLVPKVGWMTTGYQGCIRAVRRKLRELRPDIVHGQGTERDCAVTAVFSGFPNVLTIHGNMAELARLFGEPAFSYGWLNAHLENFTLPRSRGVFCNSAYTESLVRPRAKTTWCVPNPLRSVFFEQTASTQRETPLRLVNIGLVSPRKRQVELLALAQRLHERGVQVVFEFVGDIGADEYGHTFRTRIAEAEQKGFSRWCGHKTPEELVSLLDRAGGAVHFPSEEAFGLVVAEALARNLKFFGARVGGIQDIATGVELAELFASDDWVGLEEAIVRWAESGALRPTGAAETMRARYHPRVIAERHLEIYREVLSTRA